MNREEIINGLLELCGEDFNKINLATVTEDVFNEALNKMLEKEGPINADILKPVFDEIFELCPYCNFIPLACETNDYNGGVHFENDELISICEYYHTKTGYWFPNFEDENMTGKDSRRLWELYHIAKEAFSVNGIKPNNDINHTIGKCKEVEGGKLHHGIYGYYKPTNKIEYIVVN